MPEYLYQNEKTGEIVSVIQTMREKHEYFKDGIEYKRIFCNPQASLSTKIDPFSQDDFVNKTANIKGGTVGDLWDISGELSEKRKEKDGVDKVKQQSVQKYEQKTKKPHPHKEKKKIEVDFANKEIKI